MDKQLGGSIFEFLANQPMKIEAGTGFKTPLQTALFDNLSLSGVYTIQGMFLGAEM